MQNAQVTPSDIHGMRPVGSVPKEANRKNVESLNRLLASEYTLFTKTLNYHWNIVGLRFHSLHEFLETQYRDLLEVMDNVAERIRILGEIPISSMDEMVAKTKLSEKPGQRIEAEVMIKNLLCDHWTVQELIKEFLDDEGTLKRDPGTEDFLVALLQKHEMTSWQLKSHLS